MNLILSGRSSDSPPILPSGLAVLPDGPAYGTEGSSGSLLIISPYNLYLNPRLVVKHYQFWRLVTNFLYFRKMEEHNRRVNELRGAVNSHAGDAELRIIADGVIAHYDEIFRIKGDAAKADVFHILSGMWKTPAERCFL